MTAAPAKSAHVPDTVHGTRDRQGGRAGAIIRRCGCTSGSPGPQVAGNLAVQQLLHAGVAKAKLKVSQPSDPDEQEADQVADQIVRAEKRMGTGAVEHEVRRTVSVAANGRTTCPTCEEERAVHRKGKGSGVSVVPSTGKGEGLLRGGQPLPSSVRAFFEPRFGHDFGDVRVHTGASASVSAQSLAAKAYTTGNHIVFGAGQYSPYSEDGRRLLAHELTHVVQGDEAVVRRDALQTISEVGSGIVGGISRGVESVTGTVRSGVNTVVGTVTSSVQTVGSTIAQGITNLGQVLGIPAPAEGNPDALRTLVSVLNNSTVRTALTLVPPPGAGIVLRAQVMAVAASLELLDFAWRTYQNPQPLLNDIREALGRKMAEVGPRAMGRASAAVPASAPDRDGALDCIWRHLEPKLDYIASNWWEVLLGMGRDLLWPWPGVASDFGHLWTQLKLAGTALWELRINDAIDHILAALRHLNAALGRLYGWFLLASVLVGAVVGFIGGLGAEGAGAIPGAAAGAASGLAFAGEVGMGLLIATFIIEGASIAKSGYNLARSDRTAPQRECDCEIIAGSSITVAIAGAMALLGALAARLAKALLQRVANRLFEPPQRPPRSTERGRVVEARITLGELIKARFNVRRVTVTDRLTPGGLLGDSGNFPGIDIATDAQVTIRSQGQVITDAATLRTAMGNNQHITVDISGGNVISVRSRGGAGAFDRLQGDINQVANFQSGTAPSFTSGSRSPVTATVTNPTSRVLVGVYETGRLTATQISQLEALAAQRGVTLRLHEGIPPNPIALTTIESMPGILGELSAEGTQVAGDQEEGTTLHCILPT